MKAAVLKAFKAPLEIVDFPSPEQAMKTSVALAKQLGISFSTLPAVSVEDFDMLVG